MNFSFVKDIHVVGKKWLEIVVKRTFRAIANFGQQALVRSNILCICTQAFMITQSGMDHSDLV